MLAPKAQEHKIWPEKVFSTNNPPPPPHLSSQNDQRDVGIILSHRCWVEPPARQVGHPCPEPPLPSRRGGGWENGLPCPPPPAEQFSSRPVKRTRQCVACGVCHRQLRKAGLCRFPASPPPLNTQKSSTRPPSPRDVGAPNAFVVFPVPPHSHCHSRTHGRCSLPLTLGKPPPLLLARVRGGPFGSAKTALRFAPGGGGSSCRALAPPPPQAPPTPQNGQKV